MTFFLLNYICRMRKLQMDELNRKSVSSFKSAEKFPLMVVLDNVRSMHNVGSVFRTADAFLLQGLCLCGYTPKPPHRDIHKTALGATETVHWTWFPSARDAVDLLHQDGYRVLAVEQVEGSIRLEDFIWNEPDKLALVFGNEVEGVSQDALAVCDGSLEIPQFGMKHSLNISVATGIVLWEMIRGKIK